MITWKHVYFTANLQANVHEVYRINKPILQADLHENGLSLHEHKPILQADLHQNKAQC